jgi:hypothetical protein
MCADELVPELSEAELDALIAQWGLELSPTEQENVLRMARALQRAAALVRSYNGKREEITC